jgi:hypothetical protein
MDPYTIRFSQASIGYRFRDGRTIDDLADDLRVGSIQREDVPPLRLFEREGMLFTLDNRRLEAFRRAGISFRGEWQQMRKSKPSVGNSQLPIREPLCE